MLLPSALPCDGRAPSSPLRRSSRQSQQMFASYRSPPLEEPNLMANATSGLIQTCKRLHQILSVDRSSTPPPSTSPMKLREVPQPSTPLRRTARGGIRTPVNKNKRCRAVAFSGKEDDIESENSDQELRDPFSTPKNKRARLTTAPSPPNRNLRFTDASAGASEEEDAVWTSEEDRQLVELVLRKLKLSKDDWEECARSLGRRNGKALGKRWDSLISNRGLVLRDKRRIKPRPSRRV